MKTHKPGPLAQRSFADTRSVISLTDALARPESYPFHPESVEVRETHISWVFLAGDRAYKLKKPLVLSFLDYGTAARRHALCREEVRLNRTLARDVYLGVRAVALDEHGNVQWLDEDDASATDYLVEMRRYDECATMAARLAAGALTEGEVRRAAEALAQFHSQAQIGSTAREQTTIVDHRFELNTHQLLEWLNNSTDFGRVLRLERFAHAFIAANGPLLQSRAGEGHIRAGHGDMRADHILLEGDEVRVVDCVEFDPALRELDVADDLAFLVLDLTARGGADFVPTLLDAYATAGGSLGGDGLIDFFACYRALVRAKVALIRDTQRAQEGNGRLKGSQEADAFLTLAESFVWRARMPLVLVVCGAPASGKTALASALKAATGLPIASSDVTRKQLLGIRPTARAPLDAYQNEVNLRTYTRLGETAASLVSERGGAIVDATCRHLADRSALLSALRDSAPVVFVECRVPRAELDLRARARQMSGLRVSDADPAVVTSQSTVWDPLDEVDPTQHVIIRADRAVDELVEEVTTALDGRAELVRKS